MRAGARPVMVVGQTAHCAAAPGRRARRERGRNARPSRTYARKHDVVRSSAAATAGAGMSVPDIARYLPAVNVLPGGCVWCMVWIRSVFNGYRHILEMQPSTSVRSRRATPRHGWAQPSCCFHVKWEKGTGEHCIARSNISGFDRRKVYFMLESHTSRKSARKLTFCCCFCRTPEMDNSVNTLANVFLLYNEYMEVEQNLREVSRVYETSTTSCFCITYKPGFAQFFFHLH